jgi:hypothetical protein
MHDIIKLTIPLLLLASVGCTDATLGKLDALGNTAKIQCYSGGVLIYEGKSTGKVKSENGSDGYFFRAEDGFMREVSGDCIVTYDK